MASWRASTALRAAIGDGKLIFEMRCSRRGNAVTRAMGRLLHNLGINGRRGLGFYTLRHTFRTIADSQRDFPAIRIIMGHADGSIDDAYRERVEDDRLRAVTDHVRAWLFAPAQGGARW
jgi:integrase